MDNRLPFMKKAIELLKLFGGMPKPTAQEQQPLGNFKGQCLNCKKNNLNGSCKAYKNIPLEILGGIKKCRYYSPKVKQPSVPQQPSTPAQAPAAAPVAGAPGQNLENRL